MVTKFFNNMADDSLFTLLSVRCSKRASVAKRQLWQKMGLHVLRERWLCNGILSKKKENLFHYLLLNQSFGGIVDSLYRFSQS